MFKSIYGDFINREKLEFVQAKIKGQVPNNMLIEIEKELILEVEKWSSIEEQVL